MNYKQTFTYTISKDGKLRSYQQTVRPKNYRNVESATLNVFGKLRQDMANGQKLVNLTVSVDLEDDHE